jgi:uncharacterized repeat protein (TIGR01451 family)
MRAFRIFAVPLACAMLVAVFPSSAAAAPTWQITVSRIDGSPQPSGAPMRFRIQAQCAAVDAPECRDSVVSWPASAPSTFSMPASHPAVSSFGFDAGTATWTVDLQDAIAAGTSVEFDVVATAPNHVTPDGTPVTLDATIDASNTASATASASGAWSAQANLGIEKYLAFGPDTDALLDQPVKYYLYPCDPSWDPAEPPGHLYVEDATIVDTLPTGVQFVAASPGGSFDASANTVAWTPPGILENRNCAFEGPSDHWVEVVFPSSQFGPTSGPPARIEATNTATVTAYPIGRGGDSGARMTDTDSLLHGFSLPNPLGTHTKRAWTPYFGTQNLTFENDRASFDIDINTAAAGTTPYTFRITDPLPCLDFTPNAATQYESHALGGAPCSEPAFRPDRAIEVHLDPNYLEMASESAFVASHPTLPLHVRTGSGTWQVIDVPYSSTSIFGMLGYRITGAELATALGGAVVSDVEFNSADVGLFVKVVPFDNRTAARLTLDGNVAPDTAAFPMLDQYRVRNYGHFHISANDDETYIGAIQDSVTVVDRAPVLIAEKQVSTGDYVSLNVTSTGGPLRAGEDLIVTDLLPPGVRFASLSQTYLSYGAGQWYWAPGTGFGSGTVNSTGYPELDVDIRSNLTVETIDDFAGTGRQLVRTHLRQPPTSEGWRPWVQNSSMRVSFQVTPSPMRMTYVNQMQAFPSDATSAAALQCQFGVFFPPTAANSNDPDDLDGDGVTTGDAFCQASATYVAPPSVVDVTSRKWVRGDDDAEFRPFPAIGSIGTSGGTGDFRIDLTNTGSTSLRNLVVYDVLPHVGDTGTSQSQVASPRGSDWTAVFHGIDPATVPSGALIEYSASATPCRDELAVPAAPFPSGCTDDWSASLPSGGTAAVRALRITMPSGTLSQLDPGEGFTIDYSVTYPAGLSPGQVAWNNFAYAADRVDTGLAILPSEPPKVGLAVPQIDLAATKSVSPTDLLVGQEADYTVTLDHQGAVSPSGEYTLPASTATNVTARDDFAGGSLQLVPGSSSIVNTRTGHSDGASFDEATGEIAIPTFGPNDTYTLSYRARRISAGSSTNTVEITGHPGVTDVDSVPDNGAPGEDDLATATAVWREPRLELRKLVEQTSGSGTYVEADATDSLVGRAERLRPVSFRFVVRNLGDLPITGTQLRDPLLGTTCDRSLGTLAPHTEQTIDCVWPYGFDPGTQVNSATASGEVVLNGSTVNLESTDTATVIVTRPIDLSLSKTVDADGDATFSDTEAALYGTPIMYKLTVANAAAAGDASGVTISDVLPPGMSFVTAPPGFDITTGTWDIGQLPAGESRTVTFEARIDDTAAFAAGSGANTAAVATADQPDVDSEPGNGPTGEDDEADATVTVEPDDYLPASLGDRVWLDADHDGVQDASEAGVAGVTVELLDDSGAVVATATTGPDGHYLFAGLNPGTYSVRFVPETLPSGHSFTSPNTPASSGGGADIDSDADTATGRTATVKLAGGQSELGIDAGIQTFTSAVVLTKVAQNNAATGDTVTWRITVTNDGPDSTQTDTSLTDPLAGGLEFLAAESDDDGVDCSYDASAHAVGCVVPSGLAANDTAAIDVTTRLVAPAGTEIANEVAVVGQDATRGRATVTVATSPPTGDATEGDTSVPALLASTGGTLAAVLALGGALVVAGLVMRRRRRPGR